MGKPNDPCFKSEYPYTSWTTSTTTNTTPGAELDFFILPNSGVSCPVIYFDPQDNEWQQPIGLIDGKNTFICNSDLYDPNPCTIEVDKYLRVADLNIETNRCKRYKLNISNTNFILNNSKLYIDSKILDFGMPSANYGVTVDLIDLEDNSIIRSRNHTVFVNPCECDQPTTTTTTTTTPEPTTTTTTTTPEPTTTTTTTTPEPTTTTTTTTTTTITTEAPCCNSLTIQFRTYTIPDSLTVYDADDNVIMSTGPISTGNDFITIVFNDLPCGFYFCVDAPLGGTAWDFITTGCLELNTSGGQNIDGIPYCYESEPCEVDEDCCYCNYVITGGGTEAERDELKAKVEACGGTWEDDGGMGGDFYFWTGALSVRVDCNETSCPDRTECGFDYMPAPTTGYCCDGACEPEPCPSFSCTGFIVPDDYGESGCLNAPAGFQDIGNGCLYTITVNSCQECTDGQVNFPEGITWSCEPSNTHSHSFKFPFSNSPINHESEEPPTV